MCPQCSITDEKKESSKKSPKANWSPYRSLQSTPSRPLSLKGPFTKSPSKHSSNSHSSPNQNTARLEKTQIFGNSHQFSGDGGDLVDIWEFRDDTFEEEKKLKRKRPEECSTSPTRKSTKSESNIHKEKTKTTPKLGKNNVSICITRKFSYT